MSPNKRNVLVGVVVLAAIGVLAWMVLKFANRASEFFLTKGSRIQVVADRADGLSEGSAIYYRGVSVGRVLGVRLGDPYRKRIEHAMLPHVFADTRPPRVLLAQLGDLGGAIGAALLASEAETAAA